MTELKKEVSVCTTRALCDQLTRCRVDYLDYFHKDPEKSTACAYGNFIWISLSDTDETQKVEYFSVVDEKGECHLVDDLKDIESVVNMLHEHKVPQKTIAQIFKVSQARISNWIKKNN